MSGKSDLFDYDTLSNSRRVRPQEEGGVELGVSRRAPREEVAAGGDEGAEFSRVNGSFERESTIDGNGLRADLRAAKPAAPFVRTVLKSGHGLSFIGLFIFTVLVFIRPYDLSPWLAWLSRSALITAIITILIFIPTQLGLENSITVRTREVNLILLLLLLCLISVPFAFDKVQAWGAFVEFAKVVVMFVVMVNVIRTEKRLKAILLLVITISLILSVAAINDYATGNLALGGKRIAGIIGGLFDNPNDLAIHLVTILPIVVGLALGARFLPVKLIYFAIALSVLGGIVVTFSRGGFLGLIAVFATLVWKLARKNRLLVATSIASLLLLFVFLAPGAYKERITTTSDDSATARTGELKRSIFLALRHPVFGLGMDNFILFSDTSHATHNSYTQVASEIGLTGGVVYVLFLLAAIKRVRRMPGPREFDKRHRSLPYLAVGLQASLIGYMVVSFFGSVAYLWYGYYLVGYAVCLGRIFENRPPQQKDFNPGLSV